MTGAVVMPRMAALMRLTFSAAVYTLLAGGCGAGGDQPSPWGTGVPSAGGGQAGSAAADSGHVDSPGGASSTPTDCAQVTLAPRRMWRLTPEQYDNTLRDLLGTPSTYGAGFPADNIGVGFSNDATDLLMTPLMADKLHSAAEDIAATTELTRFAPCASSQKDDTCLKEFSGRFGERAFRRPLTAAEIDRYVTLAQGPGNFDAGARLVVNAMLQSPNFLYRFELGTPRAQGPSGTYDLDDYEIASELSYLLWQSMPDDELFQAAKAHKLRAPAELMRQVMRMLKAPAAKDTVRDFVFDWLELPTIATVPKDTTRYPELTADIRAALSREAESFVDSVMFGQGPLADGSIHALLNGPTPPSDATLMQFYDPSASGLGAQDRRGVLTLGGVLLTHSRSNDSSPIHRGKLVRERFLCQPLPPPPPGLLLQPPGLDPMKTSRERYADHSSNAYCASCHKLMDPIGLAFEHFDGIGRYRADDTGLPIDESGTIVTNESAGYSATDADGDFVGTDGLIDKLQVSQTMRGCYALEWFRFAYGEGKTERDGAAFPSCQAKSFQQVVAKTSGSLVDIVTALVQSDWFMARTGAPSSSVVEANDPPPSAAAPNPGVAATPSPTGTTPGVQVTKTVDNDWGMGYCYTYELKNTTMAPLTWSVPLDVRGKMNNHWECNVTGDSGAVVFTGADHNKTIMPSMTAQFGFCAVTN
jgi:hypothetical protein